MTFACEIFDPEYILTIAHHPKKVLGPIEQRKIKSTYISQMLKNRKMFKKWSFLAPNATSLLEVPPETQVLISFSSGFSHGIKVPENVKHISYILDPFPAQLEGFGGKLFNQYVDKWRRESLDQVDQVIYSNEMLKSKFPTTTQSSLIDFPFNLHEFPLLDENHETVTLDYFVFNIDDVHENVTKKAIELANKLKIKIKFLGHEENWSEETSEGDYVEFWGHRCPGDLSFLVSGALCSIDLSQNTNSELLLATLASGRPIIAKKNLGFTKTQGIILNEESLETALIAMMENPHVFFRKELRNSIVSRNQTQFKKRIEKVVNSFMPAHSLEALV